MTITINSGGSLLIIIGIIFVVLILSMLLKKGDFRKKIISLIIIVVLFAFVFFMFGRPAILTADDNGLRSTAYGKINFNWNEVDRALYVEDYQETSYKPVIKLNGTALTNYRVGKFRLSGGENVTLITQSSKNAVIFYTDDKTYLLAVDELEELMAIASDYVDFE